MYTKTYTERSFIIEPIATRAGTRALLERYGLHTRKRLGQHYLVDPHVLSKIINAAELGPHDCVLEIGPGIGAVTQALAGVAGQVCAVELDTALIPVLCDLFADAPHVSVHHGDILKMDLPALLAPYAGMRLKVVANLPYYVTTPVLMRLLENRLPERGLPEKDLPERSLPEKNLPEKVLPKNGLRFYSLTVMVQREVAERMAAKPGVKAYGALSLAVQYHADVTIAAYVPPNCFMPRPKVDSAVVHLSVPETPRFTTDAHTLFQLIHAAFNQRRKTLVNALSAQLPLDKSAVVAALTRCGFSPDIRGEALDLASFVKLSDLLMFSGTPSDKETANEAKGQAKGQVKGQAKGETKDETKDEAKGETKGAAEML